MFERSSRLIALRSIGVVGFSTAIWIPTYGQRTSDEHRLARARSVECSAQVWHEVFSPAHERKMARGATFSVAAKQPASLRIDVVRTPDPSTENGTWSQLMPYIRLVADGKQQVEVSLNSSKLKVSPAAKALKDVLSSGQDQSTLATLTWVVHNDILFSQDFAGLRFKRTETMDKRKVRVYELEEPFAPGVSGKQKWVMLLDENTSLPKRISLFVSHENRPYSEALRTDYSAWRLNKPIPNTRFSTSVGQARAGRRCAKEPIPTNRSPRNYST